MFETMSEVLCDYTENLAILVRYSSEPIETEDEVLERSELMDFLMDTAKSETDISMMFAQSIADRIEEYEREFLEMPKVPAVEMLAGLIDIKGIKQADLKHIAPQSVVSEILNGKREINIRQAKGFAEYFDVSVDTFID
ncbi:DNA-binding protein [Vibrio breoganii]|nr:DNA-binding protein [Vibrio breoganii]